MDVMCTVILHNAIAENQYEWDSFASCAYTKGVRSPGKSHNDFSFFF